MRTDCRGRTGWVVVARLALCVGMLGLLPAKTLPAQVGLMRVEEDWELELMQPDARLDAPQVLLVLNPLGESSEAHFEVDINHASLPTYLSGGLQLRAMQGADCVDQQRLLDGQRLTVESDVVRWTQVVERQDSGFVFGITTGSSSSWGSFGDTGTYVRLPASGVFTYSPATSLSRSGVIYAGNRVKRLTLARVRLIDSSGHTTELAVDQSVQ